MNWLWGSKTNGTIETTDTTDKTKTVKRVRKNFKISDVNNYKNKYDIVCFLCEVKLESPYKTNGGDNFTIHYEIDHWDDNRENNNFNNLRLLCPNCHVHKTKMRQSDPNWLMDCGFGSYPCSKKK